MKRIAPEPVGTEQQLSEHKQSSPAKRQRFEIGQICSICQETLTESDTLLKTLTCGHIFHLNCAEQWLRRKALCPNCRSKISVNATLIPSSDSESSDSESSNVQLVFSRTNNQRFLPIENKDEDSDSDWESDSSSESEGKKADGDTILTIGRHAMKSFAVIVVEDPMYCKWVMSVERVYGALKIFQNYLFEMRKSGQLSEDRLPLEEKRELSVDSSSSWVESSGEEIQVGFGRYADLTYSELAEQEPQYCLWILRLQNTMGRMNNLQNYLRRRQHIHAG